MAVRRDSHYALVLLGMQNELVHPEGFFHRAGFVALDDDERQRLLTNVGQLAARMRAAERPVIHGQWAFRPDYLDCSFSVQWRRRGLQEHGALVQGTFGAAIVDGLEVAPDDFLLPLKSHSAFLFSHLDRVLHNCGVDTCILVGGMAQGSIDDTARQGAALGYRMLVVPDAIYPLHSPHLDTLRSYADRVSTDELLAAIGAERLPTPGAAPAGAAAR